MAIVDFFGNEISIGDYVFYPGQSGHRTLGLCGVVTKLIEESRVKTRRVRRNDEILEEEYTEDKSRIQVKSLKDKRRWGYDGWETRPDEERTWEKTRTITRIDVVTIVHPDHYDDTARLTVQRFREELV